jgi:hypothetical protein
MDPVTIGAVLAAVAGGAGGALGAQVWAGVGVLVRRPFRRDRPAPDAGAAVSSGEVELAALQEDPAGGRAVALAEVLVARAAADFGFGEALAGWWGLASQVQVGGDVTNTISGGTFQGPVLQGRDFTNLSFGSSAPPGPSGPPQDAGRGGRGGRARHRQPHLDPRRPGRPARPGGV